jgi:hypothetical protein
MQGYGVGGNWAKDQDTAGFMSKQARDINDMLVMPPSRKPGAETFGLKDDMLIGSELLPGMKQPEPLVDYQQDALMRQMRPEAAFDYQKQHGVPTVNPDGSMTFPTSFSEAPMINQADVQQEHIVPQTMRGPDTQGPEQFDMLQAARNLMATGDTDMMKQGFQIYASLKTPDAVKPQLVTSWNPETQQEEQRWMVPGSADGVMAGLKKPPDINYNQPFMPDGTPNLAYQTFKTSTAKAGAPKIEVSQRTENLSRQESKQSEVYGGDLGKFRAEAQTRAFQAPGKISQLDRMATLLEGVDSGKLSGVGLEMAKLAKSFGLNLDPKLGNKQAAEALAIEMALAMREPGSGPMTDKDFDNYLNTVPSLAKSAQGRREITATLKAKARRDIEMAKMMRDYAKKNNGVIDDDFLDQAAEYMASNPVIPGAMDYGSGWKMQKVK